MISPVASDACVNKVHQTARVPLVAGAWPLRLVEWVMPQQIHAAGRCGCIYKP
jgi:hypothetical protein